MSTALPNNRNAVPEEAIPTGGPLASTIVPLGAGLPWSSDWLDVAAWGALRLQALVAAIGGTIWIDWSIDGVAITIPGVPAVVAPGALYNPGAVAVAMQHARVTYLQGGGGASGPINVELLASGSAGGGGGVGDATSANQLAQIALEGATVESQPVPSPFAVDGVPGRLQKGPDGSLQVRGPVSTDDGAFSDDFPGSALATSLSGASLFTLGTAAVVGTLTKYKTEVRRGDYVYLDADVGPNIAAQVERVVDDFNLVLVAAYGGTGALVAGPASVQNWANVATGIAGSVLVVGASDVVITSGANPGTGTFALWRALAVGGRKAFLPVHWSWYGRLQYRNADNQVVFGIADRPAGTHVRATLVAHGADETLLDFAVASSGDAADVLTTTITLPGGAKTSDKHLYELYAYPDLVVLLIDSAPVAGGFAKWHLPPSYRDLGSLMLMQNLAIGHGPPRSTCLIKCDETRIRSINLLETRDATVAQLLEELANLMGTGVAQEATQLLSKADLDALATYRPGTNGEIFAPVTLASITPTVLFVSPLGGAYGVKLLPAGTPLAAQLARFLPATPTAIIDTGTGLPVAACVFTGGSCWVTLTGTTSPNVSVGQWVFLTGPGGAAYAGRVTVVTPGATDTVLTLHLVYAGPDGTGPGSVAGPSAADWPKVISQSSDDRTVVFNRLEPGDMMLAWQDAPGGAPVEFNRTS